MAICSLCKKTANQLLWNIDICQKCCIRQCIGIFTIGILLVLFDYTNFPKITRSNVPLGEFGIKFVIIFTYQFLILAILLRNWIKGKMYSLEFLCSKTLQCLRSVDILILALSWILFNRKDFQSFGFPQKCQIFVIGSVILRLLPLFIPYFITNCGQFHFISNPYNEYFLLVFEPLYLLTLAYFSYLLYSGAEYVGIPPQFGGTCLSLWEANPTLFSISTSIWIIYDFSFILQYLRLHAMTICSFWSGSNENQLAVHNRQNNSRVHLSYFEKLRGRCHRNVPATNRNTTSTNTIDANNRTTEIYEDIFHRTQILPLTTTTTNNDGHDNSNQQQPSAPTEATTASGHLTVHLPMESGSNNVHLPSAPAIEVEMESLPVNFIDQDPTLNLPPTYEECCSTPPPSYESIPPPYESLDKVN